MKPPKNRMTLSAPVSPSVRRALQAGGAQAFAYHAPVKSERMTTPRMDRPRGGKGPRNATE